MKACSIAILSFLMPVTQALALPAPLSSAPSAAAARPPQYVVFAFDGSKSVDMWQETQAFADEMTKNGKPLRFTYFINAAYYLNNGMKTKYDAPENGPGKSAIGFGGSVQDVLSRYDQTNLAFTRGHEIANHAAGHFDGTKWTDLDWKNEFTQFYDMIFDIFRYNETQPTRAFPKWSFNQKEMIGFRAPQLGQNAALYRTLPNFGIAYDTSLTSVPNAWPKKNAQGTWSFPLASIPVAGTGRKTLSMDYNFYFVQSNGQPQPQNEAQFEEQMYESYIGYFNGNYNGNRAPINIGHHFSKWNGGAYWNAMKRFSAAVCGLPEVKCVTYRELMTYMESLSPTQVLAYQAARFPKGQAIQLAVRNQPFDVKMQLSLDDSGSIGTSVSGAHASQLLAAPDSRLEYFINGQKTLAQNMNLDQVRALSAGRALAYVHARLVKGGKVIQSVTHQVLNLGSGSEQLSAQPEEDRALIADPIEAHDE